MRSWAAIVVIATLLLPTVGQAKKSADYKHTYDQVWRATVRLIRVEQGYPIRDRDDSIGYLLFDYRDDGRTYPGSVELIQIEDQGGGSVRAIIQIPAMPGYIERMLLDKLEKKLTQEYGEPAAPKKPEARDEEEN